MILKHLLLVLFGILCAFPINFVSGKKVLVCYWGTWSHYRPGVGKFSVDNIPPDLCTNIVYSFFGFGKEENHPGNDDTVFSLDPWLDLPDGGGLDMIRKTIALRNENPELKVTMAIGGWSEGSEKYSSMARNPTKRATFITSVMNWVKEYGFDGVDMDWEYPARRGGIPEDKENFVLLLKVKTLKFVDKVISQSLFSESIVKSYASELREALDEYRQGLLLTSAFGAYEKFIDVSYDIPEISKYLDYFHLMLYDYKMYIKDDAEPGGTLIGHHSPLFNKEWEVDGNGSMTDSFAVESFISRGAPPEKLVFGVGTYAKTYKLFNRSMHNFYDEAAGPGEKSQITGEPGTSAYFEICLEFLEPKDPNTVWEINFDNDYKVPYAYSDTKWMGYDNEISARIKTDYAMKLGLGGMMVWSLDFDDFANYCKGWRNFAIVATLKERLAYYDNQLQKQ